MPYPTKYTRQYDFYSYQNANPNRPLPGDKVNFDLNAVQNSIQEIVEFLKPFARSDGKIMNGAIGVDQLSSAVKAMIGDADGLAELEAALNAIADNMAAASASAAAAELSETNAATSETNAATSATNAATSATATAADAASTAADAIATAADRVQTGTDAATATTQAGLAQTAAIAAAGSLDSFDDRYLGAKAADPTVDNDGDPLLDGALYWNTSTGLKIYNAGTTTWNSYSAAAGIASVVEDTTPQLGGDLDLNGHAITGMVIGTDVQAYDVDTMKSDTTKNLTAGFTTTSYAAGSKSSGTFTPDPANGNIQHYTNGGAHTLAPPASPCTMVVECTNASAGALTTSGFTIVDGDTYSSSGTKKHIFYITKTNSSSHLDVRYVTGT